MPARGDRRKRKARLDKLAKAAGPRRRAPGPRRPQGKRERRGEVRKPGQKRVRAPLHETDLLDMIVTHFDDVYRQLNAQIRLIAKIQQRVDALVAALRRTPTLASAERRSDVPP
jgi:hypothetical protein